MFECVQSFEKLMMLFNFQIPDGKSAENKGPCDSSPHKVGSTIGFQIGFSLLCVKMHSQMVYTDCIYEKTASEMHLLPWILVY